MELLNHHATSTSISDCSKTCCKEQFEVVGKDGMEIMCVYPFAERTVWPSRLFQTTDLDKIYQKYPLEQLLMIACSFPQLTHVELTLLSFCLLITFSPWSPKAALSKNGANSGHFDQATGGGGEILWNKNMKP